MQPHERLHIQQFYICILGVSLSSLSPETATHTYKPKRMHCLAMFSLVTVSHRKNPNFFNTIVKTSKKIICQHFNIIFLNKEMDYTDKVNNILPLSFCILFSQIKRHWPKSRGMDPWVKCSLCKNEDLNSDPRIQVESQACACKLSLGGSRGRGEIKANES